MFGLRVRMSGRPAFTASLEQDSAMIVARVHAGKSPEWHVGGIDDRGDHLVWARVARPRLHDFMEITVLASVAGRPPRRAPRSAVDQRASQRSFERYLRSRPKELRALLRSAPTRLPQLRLPPCKYALEVSLNGRRLARCGVGEQGTLTADVCANWRPGEHHLSLHVDATEHAPYFVGLQWARTRRVLQVGDRVRITFIPPLQLDAPRARPRSVYDAPITRVEIRRKLRDLERSRVRHEQRKEANLALFREYDERRPPPRRYPRVTIIR